MEIARVLQRVGHHFGGLDHDLIWPLVQVVIHTETSRNQEKPLHLMYLVPASAPTLVSHVAAVPILGLGLSDWATNKGLDWGKPFD